MHELQVLALCSLLATAAGSGSCASAACPCGQNSSLPAASCLGAYTFCGTTFQVWISQMRSCSALCKSAPNNADNLDSTSKRSRGIPGVLRSCRPHFGDAREVSDCIHASDLVIATVALRHMQRGVHDLSISVLLLDDWLVKQPEHRAISGTV